MLVELLNEILNEASPFYFYVSWILTVFCLFNFVYLSFHARKDSSELMIRDYHANQYRLLPSSTWNKTGRSILNWITAKTKRKDSPEDDDDNLSFSLYTSIAKKRGGKLCTSILYSPSLKNIVLD